MQAADMPRGSSLWGYSIVRRTHEEHQAVGHTVGSTRETAMGARAFLYTGGTVADDEQVIDFATALKMVNRDGELFWMQEPGGQILTDEQVDVIIASGADYRLG